jgi:hypothetical protein
LLPVAQANTPPANATVKKARKPQWAASDICPEILSLGKTLPMTTKSTFLFSPFVLFMLALVVSCSREKSPYDVKMSACLEKFDEERRSYEAEHFADTLNKLVHGKAFPDLEFTDMNGETFTISSMKKPVLILNFNVFNGNGHAYLRALNTWSLEHDDDICLIVNALNSKDELLESGISWTQEAYDVANGTTSQSAVAMALANPRLRVIPSDSDSKDITIDEVIDYINDVRVDGPKCSIYYISKNHTIARIDPYHYLLTEEGKHMLAMQKLIRDSLPVPETDRTLDYLAKQLDTYIFKR